ncbi:MAG: response regulator [Leptolyngbya sp. SIO1E4]|nr:response regulator [Leptolyngbya sp. SIO1E4]
MTTILPNPLLVIEDSNADFRMLKRLLRQMDVQNPIYRCQTGDEALELMYRTGRYEASEPVPQPTIIMLDLNLPGTDGRAVLARLKQDQAFSKIPIIVFTTSSAQSDIEFCYQQGANGYMVKPVENQALKDMVQAFVDYWLGANTSPFFVFS